MKLDNFVPFCGRSYGKVITQAITEFVDFSNLTERQQYENRSERKAMCLFSRLKIASHSAFSLAHLSRRLIGELIVYPCSGVRRCRRRRCHSQFSNIFSSKTAWPFKAKFYVEPPWEVCIKGLGHMTKMAVMPIMVKTFKNILLQNQKSYDLETWHAASGTQALQSFNKW